MTTWNRVQGDIGDTIVAILDGIADLTVAQSVAAHVKLGATRATLDAIVTDPDARTVTVELGDADGWLATAKQGQWTIEYQVTFLNGDVVTWPDGPPDRIVVRADQDPIPEGV